MDLTKLRTVTWDQYIAEAKERFGPDHMNWKFVCPACGHIASVADYKAAGAPDSAVAFSCVGRWAGAKRGAFEDGKDGPCDYAGAGLFCISLVKIEGAGYYFELADAST